MGGHIERTGGQRVGKLRQKDGYMKKHGGHRRTHGDLGGDMGTYVGLSTG